MQDFQKKYFADPQSGRGNFDDADFVLGENEWMNLENCRTRSTDAGVVGTVEAIGSTILKSTIEPSVTTVYIGSCEDGPNNRFVWFLKGLHGPFDKILCYDMDADTVYTVLLSSQVEGGLNFDKYHLIDARVINGILYWTDDFNEPKKVNIDAAIKMNHPEYITNQTAYNSPLDYTTLTVIRQPPSYPLQVNKTTEVGFTNNFIANFAFQFYYRFFYRDNEYSVLSTNSRLIPYNYDGETFNAITVTIPGAVFIEQDVQRIEVVVQFGNGGNMFIIKTWDKSVATEAQEIQDHNDATGQLVFTFFNNIIGEPVDSVTQNKPFERIPLLAKTNESARNRFFYGNVLLGYNAPTVSSLAAEIQTVEEGGDPIAFWIEMTLDIYYDGVKNDPTVIDVYIVSVPGASPQYYYFASIAPPSIPPDPIDLGTADFSSDDLAELFDIIAGDPNVPIIPHNNGYTYTSTVTGSTTALGDGTKVFKSNSTYRVAVVFYDRYRRKSGVVFVDGNSVDTPERTYDQSVYNIGIAWTLSNSDALNEIPDWAYYYQVVRTKNLSIQSFVQARAKNITYVLKADDGTLSYATSAYAPTNYAIGVDISALNGFGVGYIFNEGDLIDLYFDGSSDKEQLPIIGQDGKWILCGLKDLSTLDSSVDVLFDIFTPYATLLNEFYYEVGAFYAVTSPGTVNRQYGTLAGTLSGDTYLLIREPDTLDAYFVETMSPNDKYWFNWYSDIGWVNIVDRIGQVRLKNAILFSDTYIEGTRVNGLSSFAALSQSNIPLECGPIQKLILTSKINNELGVVMLSICTDETASLYLGEVQLLGSTGNADVVQVANVVGTINVLKGSYGTLNPESVVEFKGLVFWLDRSNGKIIQYSVNGLFPISDYKMSRYWKLFCDQFNSMTTEQIEALGNRPFVFLTVDPHHYELLVSVPKLLEQPPRGYLPDYPSMIYPFDIWDGQGKTLVYKLAEEPNYWQGSMAFVAEGFLSIQNKLFSFKFGQLYQHNLTTGFNEFYGVRYKARIMTPFNKQFNIPKTYDNIKLESNMRPTLTYLYANAPYQQATDLIDFDYKDLEGMLYAPIYRNKLIPTAEGFVTTGLLTGQKVRTPVLLALFEFTVTNANLNFRFVTINYQLSAGHKQ